MFDNPLEDRARLRAVESELLTLAGNLAAATCRYLQLLAEFDTAGGWSGPGLRSCAHWLSWRVGESLRTAREHLRVAHALAALPLITAAFAAGRVSYAKVRALTRIATPATEDGLLAVALHGTASHVEAVVAAVRAQQDPGPATAERALRWSQEEDGSLRVVMRLPAEQGAVLVAAVEAAMAADEEPAAAPDGSAEPSVPIAARRLDALLSLVTGQRPIPDTTLVLHLRADLDGGPAEPSAPTRPPDRRVAWIEGGPPVHPAVAERLTCGAAVQALITDRHDHPLYLGRRRRTVTPAVLRAIRVRDQDRCVYPGCTATRRLQAHHVRWWRHGGATDLDNLALLCGFHHHLVHDAGYQLRPDGQGGFTAARPGGTPIPTAGPPTCGQAEALRLPGIDEDTSTPAWGGERLDSDALLAWLLPSLRTTPAAAA